MFISDLRAEGDLFMPTAGNRVATVQNTGLRRTGQCRLPAGLFDYPVQQEEMNK
jgi:hypothetical protein